MFYVAVWVEYSLDEVSAGVLKFLGEWQGRDFRNSHNALDLAKHYVLWYEKKSRFLLLFKDKENKKLIIKMPKLRAFRKNHYYWIKHLEFPPGRPWVLITLTLKRDISLQDAWCYINKWTSAFLKRFRDYVRKVKRSSLSYLWVVEAHQDEYPHVHLLASFPFVEVHRIYEWWVDDDGNHLSEFQGVDVRFIGSFWNVKDYVIKYLVKGHNKYWSFYRDGEKVKVRLATLFIWYFRVKLFGMSRDLRRPKSANLVSFVFVGLVSTFSVWRVFYRPFNIAMSVMWLGLMDTGGIEEGVFYLRYLRVVRFT
jgi:uncharacterized protein (DUF3820 family)